MIVWVMVFLGKKPRQCNLASSKVKLKIKLEGIGQYRNYVEELMLKKYMEIFETSLNSAETPAPLNI